MFKGEKGITLISLVITIIVLLLLSMIVISIVVGNDGIVERAKNADSVKRIADVKDNIEIWKLNTRVATERGKTAESRSDLLNRFENENLLTSEERQKIQESLDNGDYLIELNGEILDFSLTSIESIYGSINIGDIVYYNPTEGATPSDLTYTSIVGSALSGSNESGNGNSEQTFTATSADTEWIVIGKTNNQLKLMSKELKTTTSSSNLTLKGGQGWLYAEEQLHKICSIYGYGNGADKTKVITYKYGNYEIMNEEQTGTITGSGARSITLNDLQEFTETVLTHSENYQNLTNAVYVPSLNGTNVEGQCQEADKKINLVDTHRITSKSNFIFKQRYIPLENMIFKERYWLATRCIYSFANPMTFDVYRVLTNNINPVNLPTGYSDNIFHNWEDAAVRPIVYLEPSIELITSGRIGYDWDVKQL